MDQSHENEDREPIQVVWLKRDLRLSDHEPMRQALASSAQWGKVCLVYIHEPDLIARADFSAQHGAYVAETLDELSGMAKSIGASLVEAVGEAGEVFGRLHAIHPISRVWSHQESGHVASFDRDKLVARALRGLGIHWLEAAQNGVHRGARLAEIGFDFDRRLAESACLDIWSAGPHGGWAPAPWTSAPRGSGPKGRGADKPRRLRGGRMWAWRLLGRFCQSDRLMGYPGALSSPLTAVKGCSLLSAALAHGVLSDREVIQSLNNAVTMLLPRTALSTRQALRKGALFFADRLRWRSAYLQAFEVNVDSELLPDLDPSALCLEEAGDGREIGKTALFLAWSEGRTGVPMVDASMRMLASHGWINMRMRGMLASFAVGALGISWREAGLHLAREFLDYEPGIHWSQMQIHAGVSRLSAPMAYNPVKQARDHDPDGVFIRRWVPELARVPTSWIAEPWTMGEDEQLACGCTIGVDYPAPIVDMKTAGKVARDRLHGPRGRIAALAKAKNEDGQAGLA